MYIYNYILSSVALNVYLVYLSLCFLNKYPPCELGASRKFTLQESQQLRDSGTILADKARKTGTTVQRKRLEIIAHQETQQKQAGWIINQ